MTEPTDKTMAVLACGAVNSLGDWCTFDGSVLVRWYGWRGVWLCPECGTRHDLGGVA